MFVRHEDGPSVRPKVRTASASSPPQRCYGGCPRRPREALTSPAPTRARMLSIVNENTLVLLRGANRLARAALVREDVRRGGQLQVAECHRDSRKAGGHAVPIRPKQHRLKSR